MNKVSEIIFRHCTECGLAMVRAEWITGDYCWGCRAVLGRNWVKPIELEEKEEEK